MKVDQIKIPIAYWQIEEILDKRIKMGIKIENLFVVHPAETAVPNPGFYDTVVETKYGRLRFFFVPECPKEKIYVLHKAKYDYPKKNTSFLVN